MVDCGYSQVERVLRKITANYASKNLQKFTNVSSIGKNNPDFFQNFSMISLAIKRKKTKMVKSVITHLKWQIMI